MALPLDACAFCFTADKPLRLCSRCRTLSFCSRECQTRAWMPNHKRVCDALIRLQDAGEDDEDGAPLVFVGETHAGVLCPGKKKPAGVPRNFGLLQRAESHCHGTDAEADEKCMRIGGLNYIPDEERLNSWKKECLGEVDSKLLFDDIINNDHEWTAFFMHSRNLRHLITAASLLHGMADIYMKRCSFEQCANVLDWTERVPGMIAKFSQQEIAYECNYYTSMNFQMQHYKELEFLNMTFRSELNIRAGEFSANVPKFREICLYEAGRSSTFAPNDDVYVAAGTFHLRRLQLSRKMPLNYIPTEKECCLCHRRHT
ncbi:hypothetical protein ACHAXT_009251 [Thalassiosira profunda]